MSTKKRPSIYRSPFHIRRLFVSFCYEYLLKLISWYFSIEKQFHLIIYFSLSCIVAGTAFTLQPHYMSSWFDFNDLSAIAATDIKSYYGTMLIALGVSLAFIAKKPPGARMALIIIIGFTGGSALGRLLGILEGTPITSIHGVLLPIECIMTYCAYRLYTISAPKKIPMQAPVRNPKRPEDFKPLSQANFTQPYDYYTLLRDEFPVYKLANTDYYQISRYQDIVDIAKNTQALSNKLVEIIATGKPKDPNLGRRSAIEVLGDWGILPVDVFALQDPPIHTAERKIGHSGFNAKFVKSLEPEVAALCDEMMDEFMSDGYVEFIQDFAWRLPMRLIIRLLDLPEKDFEHIKDWCVDGIKSLSGTATLAESIAIGASSGQFMRYLWRHYWRIKHSGGDSFTAKLAELADDPQSIMTDQRAIATLLQLLIAGSDSSASSMGSAIKKLADNPTMADELRAQPENVDRFIEEIFRTESAFQGHFRLTTEELTLHDTTIPVNSRIFLMWGSGNRDERFWDDPDTFNPERANVKKHLTFGHGIHACLGRELARMEIRIVINKLLERTKIINIVGETPYEASIFARTLTSLPLSFEIMEPEEQTHKTGQQQVVEKDIQSQAVKSKCPLA
jgi:cytochrome P450